VIDAVVGRCYTVATPRGSRRLIPALSKVVMLSLRFAVPPCCGNPPNISVNKGGLPHDVECGVMGEVGIA
jgi:hypothetical protein